MNEAAQDPTATDVYAHLFQALSESSRLAVLQHLASGEHRVRDLVEHVGLAQSTVSKHLAFLLECGLVTLKPQGRSSWYGLAHPEETANVIASASALLAATGSPAELSEHLRRHATESHPTRSGEERAMGGAA